MQYEYLTQHTQRGMSEAFSTQKDLEKDGWRCVWRDHVMNDNNVVEVFEVYRREKK